MSLFARLIRRPVAWAAAVTAAGLGVVATPSHADVPKVVLDAQARRIAVIQKVTPAVAAVCFFGGQVCGSGVVISADGLCLTNFHVVQPTGPVMQCGLADGKLYDTVLIGQDKVGDVALVKLLPRKAGDKFAFVELADSDGVKAGDWSLAMGNPFGLALDFTPTVTYGLVSGVNRYQPPEGKGTLEYTDCIQIDTSINPGNSGGPLFDMTGKLIGINGRGSFEKRGRVNSGVGYAISINQIKNFLGHLKAGLDTDHATLGAAVGSADEDGDLSRMVVRQILEEADSYRRGLRPEDQLVAFAGRPMTSTNQFKNVLGIYPKEWRVPLTYRRGNAKKEMLVRLMGNMDQVKEDPTKPAPGGPPQPGPGGGPPPNPGIAKSPAKAMFEAKKGFANFHFNKLAQKELTDKFRTAAGDMTGFAGDWALDGTLVRDEGKGTDAKIAWKGNKDREIEVSMTLNGVTESVKPLDLNAGGAEQFLPQGSGGLYIALYQYRLMLTQLKKGFAPNDEEIQPKFFHGGDEPIYPMPADGKPPEEMRSLRVDCEVIRTGGAFDGKFFFDKKTGQLVAMESRVTKDEDPCELYFSDFKDFSGVKLPTRVECRFGDRRYATLTVKNYTLGKK